MGNLLRRKKVSVYIEEIVEQVTESPMQKEEASIPQQTNMDENIERPSYSPDFIFEDPFDKAESNEVCSTTEERNINVQIESAQDPFQLLTSTEQGVSTESITKINEIKYVFERQMNANTQRIEFLEHTLQDTLSVMKEMKDKLYLLSAYERISDKEIDKENFERDVFNEPLKNANSIKKNKASPLIVHQKRLKKINLKNLNSFKQRLPPIIENPGFEEIILD